MFAVYEPGSVVVAVFAKYLAEYVVVTPSPLVALATWLCVVAVPS
jgi:hypothetical protein